MLDTVTAVRRNHALEHATVALLLKRTQGAARIVGWATASGFYLYGDIPAEVVVQAASEGLARLQKGEKGLAVSPFCGTNIAVSGILVVLFSVAALKGEKGLRRLPKVILAAFGAILVAQPIGRLTQKYLTTSADLASVRIVRVTRWGKGKLTLHKVETRHV